MNVYSLSAYSVTHSSRNSLALLIKWDFIGLPFWGYQTQNSASTEGFTGSDTAFEEFIKGFSKEKGQLCFRRKLSAVFQQDIFTKTIVRVTLEECVCVEIIYQHAWSCPRYWLEHWDGFTSDKSQGSLTWMVWNKYIWDPQRPWFLSCSACELSVYKHVSCVPATQQHTLLWKIHPVKNQSGLSFYKSQRLWRVRPKCIFFSHQEGGVKAMGKP